MTTNAVWTGAVDNDYNNADNWSGSVVPDGRATFDATGAFTSLTFSEGFTEIGTWSFANNSPAYSFDLQDAQTLQLSGTGIGSGGGGVTFNSLGALAFNGPGTSAGSTEIFNNYANANSFGQLYFQDTSEGTGSTAANAIIHNSGNVMFIDNSTAANATIYNTDTGGTTLGAVGFSGATAGNATIENDGAVYFFANSSSGDAAITNTVNGRIYFYADNDGNARINNAGGVDFSGGDVTVGSFRGSGIFHIGSHSVTVGATDDDMLVTGSLVDGGIFGGSGGHLIKVGQGALVLTGTNSYTGEIDIFGGTLSLGDGGSGGNADGNIWNNGTLIFNRGDDYTYAGQLFGQGLIIKNGVNTLTLGGAQANNGFSGDIILRDGALVLAKAWAAGTGNIVFDTGAQTLIVNNAALNNGALANHLVSFGAEDRIDLSGVAFTAGATATYNAAKHTLSVKSKGGTGKFILDNPDVMQFAAIGDGHGGTAIVALNSWQTPVDGAFDVAGNWTFGSPIANEAVAVTVKGVNPYTVTSSLDATVAAITIGAGATLLVNNDSLFRVTNGTTGAGVAGQIQLIGGGRLEIGELLNTTVFNFGSSGTIVLASAFLIPGDNQLILAGDVTFAGKGFITLTDFQHNFIKDDVGATLHNVASVISGAGQFISTNDLTIDNQAKGIILATGDGMKFDGGVLQNAGKVQAVTTLWFNNETIMQSTKGVIATTATGALIILDGTNDIAGGTIKIIAGSTLELHGGVTVIGSNVSNAGSILLDGPGADLLTINGRLTNIGQITVNGTDFLYVGGAVTGKGSIILQDFGTVTLDNAASCNIVFGQNTSASLFLDHATNNAFRFTGSITGSFHGDAVGGDHIVLGAIDFSGVTLQYATNATGGVLTVTDDHGHNINLRFVGNEYKAVTANDFHFQQDLSTGHVDLWLV
jgi:autotransporter-associated beta strand protein